MRMAKAAFVLLSAVAMAGITSGVSLAADYGYHPFVSKGAGIETPLSPAGCQFSPSGCTTQVNGTADSTFLGQSSYVSTVTVNWSAATPNGEGGFCAPAAENTRLWNYRGSVVLTSPSGQVCEIGATGPNVRHRYTGGFTFSGRILDRSVIGTGSTVGEDDGFGHAGYVADGRVE